MRKPAPNMREGVLAQTLYMNFERNRLFFEKYSKLFSHQRKSWENKEIALLAVDSLGKCVCECG